MVTLIFIVVEILVVRGKKDIVSMLNVLYH